MKAGLLRRPTCRADTPFTLDMYHNAVDLGIKVSKAFDVVNSPLSVTLSKKYDSTIYSKAAIHLFRLLKGENKALCHVSQQDAWESISLQPGNPVSWLTMKGGIK